MIMSRLPDAVFVVDTRKEKIAVDEARKLKIPVIGIVDTNCDPDEVDFVIPGNDDALRAIRLFASRIADSVMAGRDMPGRDPGGIIVTMLIGIVGALLGGYIGQAVGWYGPQDGAGFLMSLLGAIVLLWLYRVLFVRKTV